MITTTASMLLLVVAMVMFIDDRAMSFPLRLLSISPMRSATVRYCAANEGATTLVTPEISSPTITRLSKKVEDIQNDIALAIAEIQQEEAELAKMDEEFGGEIARIKKEFARIKERSFEESRESTKMAKVDAIKLVLPITDNYFRARQIYEPLQSDGDKQVMAVYDGIFTKLSGMLEEFGATRVISVGQPFDFNMMEAIMTAPSTEYAKDIVTTEYQVGYRMGDRCIRPAMVVVSQGPGPSPQ